MTDSDLSRSTLIDTPLDDDQQALLALIAHPLGAPGETWPIFDWVARQLGRSKQEYVNAVEVLRSLPRVPLPGTASGYGLVWGVGDSEIPSGSSRVGLTIAGLSRVEPDHRNASGFANELTRFLSHLAELEWELPSSPKSIATPYVAVEDLGDHFNPSAPRMFRLDDDSILDIVRHEYLPATPQTGSSGLSFVVGPHFRQWRGMKTAAEYLHRIGQQQQRHTPGPTLAPGDLPLMLDYASYVLEAHPNWNSGRLTSRVDARPLASLMLPAYTEADFSTRIGDLSLVLKTLASPPMSDAGTHRHQGQTGSLIHLRSWLEDQADSEAATERIETAMRTLGDVNIIRNRIQHPGPKEAAKAAAALNRFGLSDPIRDWSTAWDVIRARCADALDAIRAEART